VSKRKKKRFRSVIKERKKKLRYVWGRKKRKKESFPLKGYSLGGTFRKGDRKKAEICLRYQNQEKEKQSNS